MMSTTLRRARRTALLAATALLATAVPLAAAGSAQAAVTVPTLPSGISADKVLVVGMDGLRADRIAAADAPNLKAMMANGTLGTSLLYAPPVAATSSGPGWSTIATGVWPDKHGVKDNSFVGRQYGTYPGFLTRLQQVNPAYSTFAALNWKALDTYGTYTTGIDGKVVLDGDANGYAATDPQIADAAESVLRNQNPDASYVYFGETDEDGHASGAASQAYLDAIKRQDAYLGRLLNAIKARPSYAAERWTVIVTTDHGHTDGGGHGGNSIPERSTFVLAQGPGIAAGARPIDTRLTDVAATVFHQLGVTPQPGWGLDGKPIQQRSTDAFDASYDLLQSRVDETGLPASVKGFTHAPGGGWSVDNSRMPNNGVTEWRGWALTTDEFWTRTAPGQERESFTRGRGVIAVADPDEWDDKGSPSTSTVFDSTLVSPSYPIAGKSSLTLGYATHYLQEGAQRGDVLVSFDGGADTVVRTYSADAKNRIESLTVAVPAGAQSVKVKFRMRDARNNWYWAVDDVRVG
ncbi:alkaline phosphatase family protein [Kitasatospora sp. NPDC054939]